MADPFVAEVRIFPFNFPPKGWAFCNGQLLPISQNTALFSLLGTVYGGDGKSTFALPDCQGSSVMHPGQGQGLSLRDLGQIGGSEFVTLLTSEMPLHSHVVGRAAGTQGDSITPSSAVGATAGAGRGRITGSPPGRGAPARSRARSPLPRRAGCRPAASPATGGDPGMAGAVGRDGASCASIG